MIFFCRKPFSPSSFVVRSGSNELENDKTCARIICIITFGHFSSAQVNQINLFRAHIQQFIMVFFYQTIEFDWIFLNDTHLALLRLIKNVFSWQIQQLISVIQNQVFTVIVPQTKCMLMNIEHAVTA